MAKLTHGRHNLGLKTKLVGKPSSKVAHTTSAVACNIRDFANVVEHMSTCEEKDENQANTSPDVAVLEDGKKVWPCYRYECDAA